MRKVKNRQIALSDVDVQRLKDLEQREGTTSRSELVRRLIDRAWQQSGGQT